MISNEVAKLINEQINKELYSAYLYLDMANYYSHEGLDGFANWFFIQAQEERDHAMLFRTYMLNNGEAITLTPIAAPEIKFNDFNSPLVEQLRHEKTVTASINNIYAEAYKKHDFMTMQFLDWFVKEQGEEEKNSNDLLRKFELFGNDAKSLYMLNQELSTRVYTAPTLVL